ncbi:MAG: DUF1801 domain-containing protein [Aeromicrobium sp.]
MAKILTVDEYISSLSDDLQPVGNQLADVLNEGLPHAQGVIWHGHPVWMVGRNPVAAFKAHASHVTFMIWRGQELTDRSGRLEASGSSTMANLKVRSVDDIDDQLFVNWLHQAVRLDENA